MEIYSFRIMNITKENSMLINEMVGEECSSQMDQPMKGQWLDDKRHGTGMLRLG